MTGFTQKYTIVHLFDPLSNGFEYNVEDWPLHISIAEVFAITGSWQNMFSTLEKDLREEKSFTATAIGQDLFGEDSSIQVTLLTIQLAYVNFTTLFYIH